MQYSIVIPTYNHCDDLLKPCLESIIKYTDLTDVEVIVVANGCTDNTKEYVESLGTPFKLIWVDQAIGYTKATNEGIRASTGEYVVLLNNDTELLPQEKNCWLNMLRDAFKDPQVGLTGPLQLHDDYSDADVLIFFCVMIKRTVFDAIGLLDDIYTPGGGEDIDFTIRANLAGYKSVGHNSTYSPEAGTNTGSMPIWHKDNRTFRDIPEYAREIIKRNGLLNCKRYNRNIKLNVGSGGINYPGYLSVDLYDDRADIIMDITKLDFNYNAVSEILASHVFEHLNPYHVMDILKNWYDVLKPGGKLVMEMPNIEELCKKFVTATKAERYGVLNAIYGSVNTTDKGLPSDITSSHLFGWWPESLYDHLSLAGFQNIVFMPEQIPHPECNFRVEAIKPLQVEAPKKKSTVDVTVGIPTKNRYDHLATTLYSIVNQTVKPSEIIIVDDSDKVIDIREISIYGNLLKLMDSYGIKWKVLYGQKKGQHHSHQLIQEVAENSLIFRIDDDEVAEYNTLELLLSCMAPEVGAVAPAVMMPNADDLPDWLKTNRLQTVNSDPNIQWYKFNSVVEAEHLYSCFLYRKGIVDFDLTLSPVAHREETIFTHSIYREGHKLLVNGSARVWHFRSETGGIRSHNHKDFYDNDEKIFQGYLDRWSVGKKPDSKTIVLDNGIGDHYAFKNLLPEFRARYKEITIAACYPEVFFDEPDIKLISIADATLMYHNLEGFSIYRYMGRRKWNKSIGEAYKEMYL
jgi:glycosyltransferase involved in cell wall biosynthesis